MISLIAKFDINKLRKYKAKFGKFDENSLNLYEHINDLLIILDQFKIIYDINDDIYDNTKEAVIYHDLGKAHREYQNDENIRFRLVRHEILSASLEGLPDKVRIPILLSHKDIETISNRLIDPTNYNIFRKELEEELNIKTIDITNLVYKLKRPYSFSILKDIELMLIKGYLQLCDAIASAGIKQIDKGFNAYKSFIYDKFNSIQEKVNELKGKEDIIIQAMTGLGKSATSLYWSDKVQNSNKSRRIFYILPFTASINAMYKEFLNRKISTAMLHSKAQYFLSKEMEDSDIENSTAKNNSIVKDKYSMFKKSVKQVTVSTIYQLIKAFFGCKNFEMLLAQMKNSIFIIDEIHVFKIKELAMILETLRYLKDKFNISICIMSASIPTCLLNVIKNRLSINTVITADKKDLILRHHINYYNERLLDNINKIERDLKQGKRVLVCVNSVELSQKLYDKFNEKKYKVRLLHGKFNTRDREVIEKDLKSPELQIFIGTQAIEVSLDISYDTLYTEAAPLDALLQRFGRVNRKGEKGIAEIHIYINTSTVYEASIIERTIKVLEEIIKEDKGIIYEDKLNFYLDKVYLEFDKKEYDKYAKIYKNIIDGLVCGEYDNNELDNKFGVSVLPECLIQEYKLYVSQKDYFKANSLFVNLQYKTKDTYLHKDLDILVCSSKYTSQKGLEIKNSIDNRLI